MASEVIPCPRQPAPTSATWMLSLAETGVAGWPCPAASAKSLGPSMVAADAALAALKNPLRFNWFTFSPSGLQVFPTHTTIHAGGGGVPGHGSRVVGQIE